MEYKELQNICDFCESALIAPWLRLGVDRCVRSGVYQSFEFRMCKQCYPKIHHPFYKAAIELMRQSFQDALTKLRQDWQTSAEKIGKQP